MKENQLLNKTLEILNENGPEQAYDYISNKKKEFNLSSSQIYNYLYCLASVSGNIEEALFWLTEAIMEKNYWYRPEVFEDDDLNLIRDSEQFKTCEAISLQRYLDEEKKSKTLYTWTKMTKNNIVLALHGNQQNISICKENWDFLNNYEYQVEYVQSHELDSYQLYRWGDNGDGDSQLMNVISSINWTEYKNRILTGFSAGCNVILKWLLNYDFDCEAIILQSPWIPMINDNLDDLLNKLKEKQVNILVICGNKDDDCYSLARTFIDKSIEKGIKAKPIWIQNLSHDFPDNFEELIIQYLSDLNKGSSLK